jgi:hypothetical protein
MVEFNRDEVAYTLHVDNSIRSACANKSKLGPELTHDSVLLAGDNTEEKLIGFSGYQFRHFLNNLCDLQNANYLEVGTYQGSTLISAVAGNEDVLDNVYAIDNFSEFDSAGETEKIFRNNLAKFLRNDGSKVQFFNEDCFGFDVDELEPIDIFFYDGDHSEECQRKAFEYFEPAFADVFIAVIDDWEQAPVRRGTRAALESIGFEIVSSRAIVPAERPSPFENPSPQWWNGTHVAVLRRTLSEV